MYTAICGENRVIFYFYSQGKKAESGANFNDGNDSDSGSIASSVSTALSDDLDADFQGGRHLKAISYLAAIFAS